MDDSPINNPFDEKEKEAENKVGYLADIDPLDADSGSRSLAWLIVGVAAIGCGLFFAAGLFFFRSDVQSVYNEYFPSPTLTNSPTPTNTRTPTATATPNMTATQQVVQITGTAKALEALISDADNQWEVLISDTFDEDSSNWATGTDDDEYATIIRKAVDGKYQWDLTAKQGF